MTTPATRPCVNCGAKFVVSARERNPRKYCSGACRVRTIRAGIPKAKVGTCADCGSPMWRGKTSLPQGKARCLACRRSNRRVVPTMLIGKCPVCHDAFEFSSARSKVYCTSACRNRSRRLVVRAPSPEQREASRLYDRTRNENRGAVYGGRWAKLRAQVLAEESTCHLCEFEIDPDLKWPDPWSGTGDHVVPLSAGGDPLDRSNVRAAHAWCNLSKGAKHGRVTA